MELEDNVVLIGNKQVMAYVLACNTIALSGKEAIFLKARGKNISKAVDVAQVSTRKFLISYEIKDTKLGTDTYTPEIVGTDLPQRERNISTIEIKLEKKNV